MQAVVVFEINMAVLFILAAPLGVATAYLVAYWPERSFSLLWLFGLITVAAVGLGIAVAAFHLLANGLEA